ncbi:hypothetical protein [Stenotrophomonas sp. YIM B06876]|uniref:hypothetical protein n=1 Tax=Stenotrophomonas sp. YIM B06876 TaxID=3060211 RepID=UPI002738AFB0|nr:hypothetical protein [Stenotrophomonas sp. YIM B06876]
MNSLRPAPALLAFFLLALTACDDPMAPPSSGIDPPSATTALLRRGEYLLRTSGCNDCHTAGYAEQQGKVPMEQWLTGSPLGYYGPWGTTYASNLRLRLHEMDEAQWLQYSATLHTRPMMPDFALRAMSEEDRRAIHRFVRSLGPAGAPAPAALPPGPPPPAPYLALVLPEQPAAAGPAAGGNITP